MKSKRTITLIKKFYRFCIKNGLSKDSILTKDNMDSFIETAVDGYRDYPLFRYYFSGKINKKTFTCMFKIDFKCRFRKMAGISSENRESIITIEPPMVENTEMKDYLRNMDLSSFKLLFNPVTYRNDSFDKYALKKRKQYLDEKTWYIYIFATKKCYQRQGYGKRLIKMVCSFADENGYRLCLETNADENVPMYENFGFKKMDSSVFKEGLNHYVMLYNG